MISEFENHLEVVNLLVEDHGILKKQLASARAELLNPNELEAIARQFSLHNFSEQEVLLPRVLEEGGMHLNALACLEMHEIVDSMFERSRRSAHRVQFAARLKVLCDLLEFQMVLEERELFPKIRKMICLKEREEMGIRYRDIKSRNELAPVFQLIGRPEIMEDQAGRVRYLIVWVLGVPIWILLFVLLIWSH